MAATAAAARLTDQHRAAQIRLGAQTISDLHQVWPILDVDDLDRSAARWAQVSTRIVQGHRATSARLASGYLHAFKALEVAGTSVPIVLGDTIPAEQVATSLLVTGPYRLRAALARGVPLDRAASTAEATSSASAYRHVLNGGRATILDSVAADRTALGWRRVAGGGACDFCRMLAGRGAVFREQSAHFDAHDACSCTAEPVYRE